MPDLTQAKVYRLTSPHTTKVYIGSTCIPLRARFAVHKSQHKRRLTNSTSSCEVFEAGDCRIELLEEVHCTTTIQLHARERHHIQQHGDRCVNRNTPGRTPEEMKAHLKAYRAKWYQQNKHLQRRGGLKRQFNRCVRELERRQVRI